MMKNHGLRVKILNRKKIGKDLFQNVVLLIDR